eukprot:350798-Hanusia_phi.AAC.2
MDMQGHTWYDEKYFKWIRERGQRIMPLIACCQLSSSSAPSLPVCVLIFHLFMLPAPCLYSTRNASIALFSSSSHDFEQQTNRKPEGHREEDEEQQAHEDVNIRFSFKFSSFQSLGSSPPKGADAC